MTCMNHTGGRTIGQMLHGQLHQTQEVQPRLGHHMRRVDAEIYAEDLADDEGVYDTMVETVRNTRMNTPVHHLRRETRLRMINAQAQYEAIRTAPAAPAAPIAPIAPNQATSRAHAVSELERNEDFHAFVQRLRPRSISISSHAMQQQEEEVTAALQGVALEDSDDELKATPASTPKGVQWDDNIEIRVFSKNQKCGAKTSAY